MTFAYYAAGDVIFRQNDTGENFYIILSGIVDVLVNDGGPDSVRFSATFQAVLFVAGADCHQIVQEDKTVAHLMAGASFGELALMQVCCCIQKQPGMAACKHACTSCQPMICMPHCTIRSAFA